MMAICILGKMFRNFRTRYYHVIDTANIPDVLNSIVGDLEVEFDGDPELTGKSVFLISKLFGEHKVGTNNNEFWRRGREAFNQLDYLIFGCCGRCVNEGVESSGN
jgi:hypothetical protein